MKATYVKAMRKLHENDASVPPSDYEYEIMFDRYFNIGRESNIEKEEKPEETNGVL